MDAAITDNTAQYTSGSSNKCKSRIPWSTKKQIPYEDTTEKLAEVVHVQHIQSSGDKSQNISFCSETHPEIKKLLRSEERMIQQNVRVQPRISSGETIYCDVAEGYKEYCKKRYVLLMKFDELEVQSAKNNKKSKINDDIEFQYAMHHNNAIIIYTI